MHCVLKKNKPGLQTLRLASLIRRHLLAFQHWEENSSKSKSNLKKRMKYKKIVVIVVHGSLIGKTNQVCLRNVIVVNTALKVCRYWREDKHYTVSPFITVLFWDADIG